MEMTKRERMMCALSNKQADRIPVAPDLSCLVPCKRTGKSFEEILLHANPPIWRAYLDTLDYFDFDGWFIYGSLEFKRAYTPQKHVSYEKDESGRIVQVLYYETPKGPLRKTTKYPNNDAETITEKLIKNFKDDFPKFKFLFSQITGCDETYYKQQKKELGEKGIMALSVFPANFSLFLQYFEGNLEALTYAYYDEPELFQELCEMYEKDSLAQLEIILDLKPDSILTGGSGTITLSSPEIFDKIVLPGLKKITKMCKEAGVICGVHACGKEMHLVKRCAEETDLSYINPLEVSPMGDCSLSEAKRLYGQKLALMGNLHTTNIMLHGTPDLVRLESLKAMRDAGENGGFVLSTGDQVGRDTSEENIKAMISTCKEFGNYPLNVDKISEEIFHLEKRGIV